VAALTALRLANRRIAIGVGGGIAAYKVCDLVRMLQREGAEVRVAMTEAAQQFVTPLTLQSLSQHAVLTNYFDPAQDNRYGHLHLARWAELFVIAPATADLLSKIESGRGDDAVTTTLLAFSGPVLFAPAMNTAMWNNEATQRAVSHLQTRPRFAWVGPASGVLADGDVGVGRLSELVDIVNAVAMVFAKGPLAQKRVLVTAGPTREAIDPVRFLSNASSGKMGFAMAQAARSLGATVTVVAGPVTLSSLPHQGLEVVSVVSADQMHAAVVARIDQTDFFVACAAVSDFACVNSSDSKVKKQDAPLTLQLRRTTDILLDVSQRVRKQNKQPLLVGFAAETDDVERYAAQKLKEKQLDFIVANDVGGNDGAFGRESNRVVVLSQSGVRQVFDGEKRQVAQSVWDLILSAAIPR
jgi:phosphopantothenoylcysteine decarboxylase / phosphopantothenate---cysteine ligase